MYLSVGASLESCWSGKWAGVLNYYIARLDQAQHRLPIFFVNMKCIDTLSIPLYLGTMLIKGFIIAISDPGVIVGFEELPDSRITSFASLTNLHMTLIYVVAELRM